MKFTLLMSILIISCTLHAQEASPVWPQIGSAFPKGDKIPKKAINRLGIDYWVTPPKVIGPYAPNWFEYSTTMWGIDGRITDKTTYFEFLKSIYLNAGFVYSDGDPSDINKVKLPFYNTNITNILYIRNKGGSELREGFKKTRGKEFLVRNTKKGPGALEDEKVNSESISIAKKIATKLAPVSPLSYDLRDEGTYSVSAASPFDFDFSPVSIKNFQVWLKGKYETLEKLNSKWSTNFKTWEEVMPLTTDEIFKRELTKASTKGNITQIPGINLAPWADHREYNDDTMQSAIARYTNAINEADPSAPVGYSGTQMPSAYGGFDFWKISNNLSWIEYYDCNGSREILKGFMNKDFPMIHAISLNGNVSNQFPRVWHGILHGDAGSLVWPFAGNNTAASIAIELDGQNIKASAKALELGQQFRKLRNGIPIVLRHTSFEKNEIAVYYSQSSIRADWILEVKKDGKSWINRSSSWEGGHNYYAAGREGYYKLLEDIGYQYTQISHDQVENNKMDQLGIKVIVMPRVISMSNKEIENLKGFVKNGGVIITDLLTGRLDEHCVDYQDKLEINELLGINRSSFAYQEETKDEEDGKSYVGGFGYPIQISMEEDFGDLKKGTSMNVLGFFEPNVTLNKAKAFGKSSSGPVLLQNSFGSGTVYTLNFDLPNYLQERNSNDANILKNTELQRAIFKSILEKSKIKPYCKITNANGTFPSGVEALVYTQGDAKFLAVQVNQTNLIDWVTLDDVAEKNKNITEIKLKIELPEAFFVTEMMSEKSLGKQKVLEVTLTKETPLIFSLLKYSVSDVSVKSSLVAENNLMPVELTIDSKEAVGDHVLNVELFSKDNKPVPHFLVNVPMIKGKYAGSFDFSHVKEKGDFELVFKDVMTGISTKKKITIK